MPRRFVLLDRDGTIIEQRHHLSRAQDVVLIPEAGSALRRMAELGLGLVIVTNQSPVGRGMITLETLEGIHACLRELLGGYGVHLDGIYFCPHLPEDECACRKPRTGLVERAARELLFDPSEAFLVGDKGSDLDLGRRVAATTFLVRTRYGSQAEETAERSADYIVDDLSAAARIMENLISARGAAPASSIPAQTDS